MIQLKRVYKKPSRADGVRILVDRLWPRGLTKERAAVDLWLKDVAPSPCRRRAFAQPIEEVSMSFERIRDEGQTLGVPTGKVLGIVDTRAEFDDLVRTLKNAGFDKITAICGEEGVQLLERVSTFFFSDLEERVLNRHIEELKAGNIIVGIETPSDRVDEAVSVATQHGARRLVHFGLMTITWHTR